MDCRTSTVGHEWSLRWALALLLYVVTACSGGESMDESAPAFPDEAELSARWISSTELSFEWPVATDNFGVAIYVLRRDGLPVRTMLPSARSVTVEDHGPGLTRQWSVVAVDSAGNTSRPLALELPGGDKAPVWNTFDLLVSRPPNDTAQAPALRLQWTGAYDDVATPTYEVVDESTSEVLASTPELEAVVETSYGAPLPLVVFAVDPISRGRV